MNKIILVKYFMKVYSHREYNLFMKEYEYIIYS